MSDSTSFLPSPPPAPPTAPVAPTASAPIPVALGVQLDPVDAPAPRSPNVPAAAVEGEPTVTVTIDGQSVTVRQGTNVLEAAKLAGRDICHFCYHPGLSIAASCRQCLVELELRGRPVGKLQPSCQIQVESEMVVHTESPAVLKARREMLEFTLKNHPIDCPICDKAGECTLQRHYMAHDHAYSRIDVAKIRKPKAKDLGREILLDAERCILCSRCVRFCEELPGTSELVMVHRGDREQIDVAEDLPLDNAYSLNVVDICPVGALTSKDFRFQIRPWELRTTETTCPGCATGCAVELHTKHERAYRVVPRFDPTVNGHWMCDEGRYTYKTTDPAARVLTARVGEETVPLAQAITAVAQALRGKKVAVVFSAAATNEANAAMAQLADLLEAERFVLGRPDGEGDALLRDADKNPNTRGAYRAASLAAKHEGELALALAGRAFQAAVLLDAEAELSDFALHGLGEIFSVALTDRQTTLSRACRVVLPTTSWAETLGTFVNRQGRLRLLRPAWRPPGERTHAAELIGRLVAALGGPSLGTAREQVLAFVESWGDTALLDGLRHVAPAPPTLLRFGNSRG